MVDTPAPTSQESMAPLSLYITSQSVRTGMSLASSGRYNPRNMEAPWYGPWGQVFADMLLPFGGKMIVLPQCPLYIPSSQVEEHQLRHDFAEAGLSFLGDKGLDNRIGMDPEDVAVPYDGYGSCFNSDEEDYEEDYEEIDKNKHKKRTTDEKNYQPPFNPTIPEVRPKSRRIIGNLEKEETARKSKADADIAELYARKMKLDVKAGKVSAGNDAIDNFDVSSTDSALHDTPHNLGLEIGNKTDGGADTALLVSSLNSRKRPQKLQSDNGSTNDGEAVKSPTESVYSITTVKSEHDEDAVDFVPDFVVAHVSTFSLPESDKLSMHYINRVGVKSIHRCYPIIAEIKPGRSRKRAILPKSYIRRDDTKVAVSDLVEYCAVYFYVTPKAKSVIALAAAGGRWKWIVYDRDDVPKFDLLQSSLRKGGTKYRAAVDKFGSELYTLGTKESDEQFDIITRKHLYPMLHDGHDVARGATIRAT